MKSKTDNKEETKDPLLDDDNEPILGDLSTATFDESISDPCPICGGAGYTEGSTIDCEVCEGSGELLHGEFSDDEQFEFPNDDNQDEYD